MERRRLHYVGNVQGVGFRYTIQRIVGGRAVTGFVRNLPDGGVELQIEGSPDELDRLQAEIHDRFAENIGDVSVTDEIGSERFGGFEIRR